MRKPGAWVRFGIQDLNAIAPADLAGALGTFMETKGKAAGERAQAQWRSDWRQWNLFAHRHGLPPFPLTVAALKAFKLECAVRGLRYGTIGRYRQTLSDVHDMMGVPFIWSATDVGNPLCAEIANGAAVAPAPAVAPIPKKARAASSRKVSTTDANASPRAKPPRMLQSAPEHSEITTSESAVIPLGRSATVTEKPNAASATRASGAASLDGHSDPSSHQQNAARSADTDDLAWSFDACRCLSLSLTAILTSGAEKRATEAMQLSGLQKYAEWALRELSSVLPEVLTSTPSPSTVPSNEIASLLRSVRTRLLLFVGNGQPKTIEQVRAATYALSMLSERDSNALARIFPCPEPSTQPVSARPASAAGPQQTPGHEAPNELQVEVANIREQLRQVAIELKRMMRSQHGRTRLKTMKRRMATSSSLH